MASLVRYELDDSIATLTLDDGRKNLVSPAMLRDIHLALDRAAADRAVVLLTGAGTTFSAGFDLGVMGSGREQALAMVRGGFELAERMLAHPFPVVVACNGHAIAMGAFLLLSADYRIGADGPFRIVANEVAIGLTMPRPAVELMHHRLTPACFQRATLLAEAFAPREAVAAGFLDRVVAADDLRREARDFALGLRTLSMDAHAASKARARQAVLEAVRAGIAADFEAPAAAAAA